MAQKLDLQLSQEGFDRLHDQVETRGENIRANAQDIRHLLHDYSILLGAVESSTQFTIIEPEPRRQRPRLTA